MTDLEPKPEKEESELEKCQKERDEYLAGWQRAKADLSNYKKDETKRFEEMSKFFNEVLIRELIGVLDSFDLGIDAFEEEGKAEKGMYLIRSQLEDVLKKFGLERIPVSVGQPLDPNLQEAIGETASSQPSGAVVEEVGRGYTLHGKVIRPARVKIAK